MSRDSLAKIHNRYDVNFVKGEGAYLFDENGDKYLDFHGGIAVTILGHNDEDVNSAAINQIKSGVVHLSNVFFHDQVTDLGKKLCDLTFAESVYFLNSGTEAVEMSIKVCRKFYHKVKKSSVADDGNFFLNDGSIPHIISFKNSFHGRTFGSISLQQRYTDGFEPVLSGFSQAEVNNIESVKSQIFDNTVAIFIEPIQGEGGVFMCDKNFLLEVKKVCEENNILLVFDEIQTGIGRTGYLYSYKYFDIEPDILLTGKALGNGFPISAVLFNNKTKNIMLVGDHGSTFGGNILSSAVANIVLNKISNDDTLSHIRYLGDYLMESLRSSLVNMRDIVKIRGMGLLVGIELNGEIIDMKVLKDVLMQGKLLCMITCNVVRMLPSMKITKLDIDMAVDIFVKAVHDSKYKNL